METSFTTIAAIIGSLGGFELVKYLLNRGANARSANSRADHDQFATLQEMVIFLQKQLKETNEYLRKQTKLTHDISDRLLEATREKSRLEGELSLKRCERRGCPERQPQNNF